MRRGSALLMAAAFVFLLEGCGASSGQQSTADRGIQVYKRGEGVYVCRESPTAPTLQELAEELRSERAERDSPTGESVQITERETVEVEGSPRSVARVQAAERDAEYWIPYTALCSRRES